MLGATGAGLPEGNRPDLRVAGSWEEMISLRDAWTALADSVGADGFSRPEFCIPVGYEIGGSAALVLQAWVGDDLVALVPLLRRTTRGVTVHRPLGTGPATSAAPLVTAVGVDVLGSLTAHLVTGRQTLRLPRAEQYLLDALPAGAVRRLRPAAPAHRFASTALADWSSPAGMSILDDPDEAAAATGLLLDGVGDSAVLLATVIDALLRGGRGFLVSDGGRGSAAWVTGGGTASLWWARGSCAPGAAGWAGQVSAAAAYAHDHGLPTCAVLPAAGASVPLRPATPAGPVSDLLVAASRGVLAAADLLDRPYGEWIV